jgi:hypothetical protein
MTNNIWLVWWVQKVGSAWLNSNDVCFTTRNGYVRALRDQHDHHGGSHGVDDISSSSVEFLVLLMVFWYISCCYLLTARSDKFFCVFLFPSFYTCRNGGSRNVQTQHAFSISFAIWARLKSHTKLYGVGLGLTGFVLLLSSHGMVQWSMYDFDCMLVDGFKIVFLWHPSWAISGWFLLHRLRVQSGLFGCPKFMPPWNGTFHALQRPLSVPFRYIQNIPVHEETLQKQ